jgi:DNA polymerase III epsilon subunit-like protein
MSLLVFDVETTGLPKKDLPLSAREQPRMIQIGAILLSNKWEEINIFSTVIRPDGWVSSAGAKDAHGITERRCDLYGVRQKAALAFFMDLVRSAGEIAAYNLPFDEFVIDVELDRLGAKPPEWKRGGLIRTCVMRMAAEKWNGGVSMKLPAAHEKATGIVYHPKHQAISDTRAAVRIMQEIRKT